MFKRAKVAWLLYRSYCSSSSGAGKSLSNISRIWLSSVPAETKWLRPCRFNYIENGVQKHRDVLKVVDGVMVLIYNTDTKKLIFVRQFRPAVYLGITTAGVTEVRHGEVDLEKLSTDLGITLELCAGTVDKNKTLEDIAREEVLEECGYDVPANSIQNMFKYRSGVGTSSGSLSLFYCEVCAAQKVSNGGGVNGEVIEVVELSVEQARQLVQQGTQINGPPGMLLAIFWFLSNKVDS